MWNRGRWTHTHTHVRANSRHSVCVTAAQTVSNYRWSVKLSWFVCLLINPEPAWLGIVSQKCLNFLGSPQIVNKIANDTLEVTMRTFPALRLKGNNNPPHCSDIYVGGQKCHVLSWWGSNGVYTINQTKINNEAFAQHVVVCPCGTQVRIWFASCPAPTDALSPTLFYLSPALFYYWYCETDITDTERIVLMLLVHSFKIIFHRSEGCWVMK